jgi:DNA-binding PadR family transcriptional regulator
LNHDTPIEELIPLRPVVFALLLVLRSAPLHGYGIMRRVNDHLGREALVGPGTLYRVLKELRDADLIEHTEPPDDDADVDARRQYYRLTERGAAAVEAEARRITALMHEANLGALVGGDGPR